MSIRGCTIARKVTIHHPDLVNLYGCTIKEGSSIGAFTEIGKGVIIGRNTSIGAYCFIPPGVVIGDNVFIGPRVTFMNDTYPPTPKGIFVPERTEVQDDVVIGAGVKILPGITIFSGCKVGAGALVTRNVFDTGGWYKGHPARGRKEDY